MITKSQVLPFVQDHGMKDYLFLTKPRPLEFLESCDENGNNTKNIDPKLKSGEELRFNIRGSKLKLQLHKSSWLAFINFSGGKIHAH